MHTLLALLRVKPASGYELARNSAIATDPVWAASHSQIYPLLHKLQQQGLVTSTKDTRGERLERTVYAITPRGEEAFQTWLEEPLHYLPYRDPFRLWIGFMDQIPPAALYRGIDEHERRNLELAERYERVAGELARGEHPFIAIRRGRVPDRAGSHRPGAGLPVRPKWRRWPGSRSRPLDGPAFWRTSCTPSPLHRRRPGVPELAPAADQRAAAPGPASQGRTAAEDCQRST